ncbi:MAG TPA: EamA family transporter [Candidatus Omnitrophota bacterium]|nr:EamA family transporter [Candidatus Omnitrophota bacterium]
MSPRRHITLKVIAALVFTDLLETLAQFCFKKSALAAGPWQIDSLANGSSFLITIMQSPFLWGGLVCVFVIFVCWSLILSKVDLSVAVPIASTSYITIPLVSVLFLGEKISLIQWSGIAFIIAGIILVSMSVTVKEEKCS